MKYYTCPYCGDHLDPGEICECRKKRGLPPEKRSAPMLNDIPANMLRYAKQNGLACLYHPNVSDQRKIEKIIKQIYNLFFYQIAQNSNYILKGVYAYDMDNCKGNFRNADGICNICEGETIIGISVQAANQGSEYTAFILLHELAHFLSRSGEHSPEFEALIDWLIANYNTTYGQTIQNDYVNFNE